MKVTGLETRNFALEIHAVKVSASLLLEMMDYIHEKT